MKKAGEAFDAAKTVGCALAQDNDLIETQWKAASVNDPSAIKIADPQGLEGWATAVGDRVARLLDKDSHPAGDLVGNPYSGLSDEQLLQKLGNAYGKNNSERLSEEQLGQLNAVAFAHNIDAITPDRDCLGK